ncbi:MAG: ABC transporter ATP-binding protein [Alcanivoracaceae bacterium]
MNNAGRDERVLEAAGLVKTYREGNNVLTVLSDVTMHLNRGERVAVIGSSGSGKSTLLNLLGGLDDPSAGTVAVCGQALEVLAEKQRCLLRNEKIGFIYQFHHLLPEFSALENAAMPLLIRGVSPAEARDRATALLEQVGLGPRLRHKPGMLSGGERQRVAIARALVTSPALILADEPTGNLDERTAASVQALMQDLNERLGIAFLIVTHDNEFASRCQRVLTLHEGRLSSD